MDNKAFCEIWKVYFHENSAWKHNKSDKHINNLRYEQINNYNCIVAIPEWLLRDKRVRGCVNLFHLKKPFSNRYKVILIHQNPIDLNSELKVVGKSNQYIAQYHINNIFKQMDIKYGELIKQFKFKIKVYANVRYEEHPEDEPTEVINHHIPIELLIT